MYKSVNIYSHVMGAVPLEEQTSEYIPAGIPEEVIHKFCELELRERKIHWSYSLALPARSGDRARFILAYENTIDRILGKEVGFNAGTVMKEAVLNAEKHAHKSDSTKRARIYSAILDDYVLIMVQTEGAPWDARNVRTTCTNEDGSLYMGENGRGHFYMITCSDQLVYKNYGRELLAIVKHPGVTSLSQNQPSGGTSPP
jgi:hypothetical protein